MAAIMLDELDVSQAEAKQIIQIAIDNEAYDSDMPKGKKDQVEAAHEIVAFCIDAWKNDGARPGDKDPEIASGAEAILEIFEIAGVEADDDGTITFLEAEEEEEDEEDEEEEDDDDEAPFEPDDYIRGYTELSPTSRVKKVRKLDPEDEEDYNTLVSLQEWEEAQDKPSSRVLNIIEEMVGEEEEEDEEGEEEEDEEEYEEDEEDDSDDDGEELAEPWKGYDKLKKVEIKNELNERFEEGELTAEQVEYVRDYEDQQDNPSKRTIKLCNELLEALGEEEDEIEGEAEEEEEEARPRKRGRQRKSKAADNGAVITLTREQILTALDSGEVLIKV